MPRAIDAFSRASHARPDRSASLTRMIPLAALILLLAAPPEGADSIRGDQDIRQSALRNASDVRRCYEAEGLRRNPALAGTLDVALTILPTGSVRDVAVASDVLHLRGMPEVAACVATVVKHWRFQRGPFVVERVVFPFQLVPAASGSSRVTTRS